MASGEVGLLRRAIGLCSRSAVAYKAAYMLSPEAGPDSRLLEQCTARYALLERLLGLLVELSTPTGQLRDLLDGIDMDPARYQDHLEWALADARCSDEGLGRLAELALTDGGLTAAVAACLRDQAAQVALADAAAAPSDVFAIDSATRFETAAPARSARPTA